MKVELHTNHCDESMFDVSRTLGKNFNKLEPSLGGNFGGIIEHLWIDVKLAESAKTWPFRFQKRISGASRMGLPAIPDSFNVGHYSVEPDLEALLSMNIDQITPYVLGLVYDSTNILFDKEKKLCGFNTELFRKNFLEACKRVGYDLPK